MGQPEDAVSTSQRPKRKDVAVQKFECPYCRAKPGKACFNFARIGFTKRPHPERMDEARKAGY